MGGKYKGRYRTESARLKGYDYRQPGYYFVTICTKNREKYFGRIMNGKMILSVIGQIADCFWREIPGHFPFVRVDEHIIMPDHVHGIIILNRESRPAVEFSGTPSQAGTQYGIKTQPSDISARMSQISPQIGSLAVIIRSYKSACCRETHRRYPDLNFAWQSRFYDRIIRDDEGLNHIRNYIACNPMNWQKKHDDS